MNQAPDPELAIETCGLTKAYDEVEALRGLDLLVPRGSVFGFLGPNGAGKTTTLRILTGLSFASSGTASVLGHEVCGGKARVDPTELGRRIGFLPDVPGFYTWMQAEEFLVFCGRLHGLAPRDLGDRVGGLLDMAGLHGVRTPIGGFSRGMLQRLGIAQALIHSPELLLLDEPTSALDPIGRKEVLELIASLGQRTTVLFSSHILADVERVCDRVAILDRGRIVTQDSVEELKRGAAQGRIELRLSAHVEVLERWLQTVSWATRVRREGESLSLFVSDLDTARRSLPAAIAEADLSLQSFAVCEPSLEEIFVDLLGNEPEGGAE